MLVKVALPLPVGSVSLPDEHNRDSRAQMATQIR